LDGRKKSRRKRRKPAEQLGHEFYGYRCFWIDGTAASLQLGDDAIDELQQYEGVNGRANAKKDYGDGLSAALQGRVLTLLVEELRIRFESDKLALSLSRRRATELQS